MKEKKQMKVKQFQGFTASSEDDVNCFLNKISDKVISVTPLCNTISGMIEYVVVYWEITE